MNNEYASLLIAGIIAGVLLVLVCVTIGLFVMVKRLIASFAKLGFLMREDAKQYFDTATSKIIDTNQSFQQMFQQVVEDGTKDALQDASKIMQTIIAKGQAEAGQAIVQAQLEAANIVNTAHKDAEVYRRQIMNQAVEAIRWTLEEYTKESFTSDQHEAAIRKLLEGYLHEQD